MRAAARQLAFDFSLMLWLLLGFLLDDGGRQPFTGQILER